MTDRIKCGKCKSEYSPRPVNSLEMKVGAPAMDNSCPMCGFGKMIESKQMQEGKSVLKG